MSRYTEQGNDGGGSVKEANGFKRWIRNTGARTDIGRHELRIDSL
jgi:hypothetical protein